MTTSARALDASSTADLIRQGIMDGAFVPGQRLIEVDLSESLATSRGNVRSALMRLDHEGLIERIANRGARVRTVTVEEAIAITEVRMVIEGLCASHAAVNAVEADRLELREIGSSMQQALKRGEILTYSQLNSRLHEKVRILAAQPVASEVLGRLLARNVRHQFQLAMRPGRPDKSLPEHLAIIDEICAGSPDGAERAARRHVASVIDALRETP